MNSLESWRLIEETHIPSLSDYPLEDVPLDLDGLANTIREPFLNHAIADFREYTPSPRIDSLHSSEDIFKILEEMRKPRTEEEPATDSETLKVDHIPESSLPVESTNPHLRPSIFPLLEASPAPGSIKEKICKQYERPSSTITLGKIYEAVKEKIPEDLKAVQQLRCSINKLIKEAPFTKEKSGPYPDAIREFIFIAHEKIKHKTIALVCKIFNIETNRHCIKTLIYKEFLLKNRPRPVLEEKPSKAIRTNHTTYSLRA